jgi:hypothetical protein
VELDDTISEVEDINLIYSLILLERKLVKFPVTSDYSRLSAKDLKDMLSIISHSTTLAEFSDLGEVGFTRGLIANIGAVKEIGKDTNNNSL